MDLIDYTLGGASGVCAGFFTNPFDVIKTRQQLYGELQSEKAQKSHHPYRNMYQSIRTIIKTEGLLGLQKGLSSALIFQFVMNSARLGLYQTVDQMSWTKTDNQTRSPALCLFWGGVSGIAGSGVGCPFYLVKTQIQAQSSGKYAVGYQHKHESTLSAFINIAKQHGFRGLWRGFSGMIPRTGVGSAAQLGTFSPCMDALKEYEVFQKSVLLTAIGASSISGFFTSVCMTPFDVVSTRVFNQGVDKHGKGLLYKNIFDCFIKTFRYEGIKGLYKGFIPNYARIAPHTVLNLTFWEEFKNLKQTYMSS